jgi:hypothetical protein
MGCEALLLILAAGAIFALVVAIKIIAWGFPILLRAVGLMGPVCEKASVLKRPARLKQQWRNDFGAFKAERDMAGAALLQYVADAALTGMDQETMTGHLLAKGWAPGEVKKGLADFNAFVAKHPLPAMAKSG